MLSVVVSAVLGSWLCTAPVQAQTRVFVAAQGSDANPCSFALPCRTFQHAHDTVAAGGEIDVLDPAGYGALTINKSISIQGHGFSGITAPAGNAISISAGATDKINLRGLLIDGLGTGNHGISFLAGGSVEIQDSVVRNFADVCIDAEPAGSAVLLISGTHVSLAGGLTEGIFVRPSGAGTVAGVFDRLVVENNSGPGIDIVGDNSTGTVNFTISNSVVANNNNGIVSRSTSAATARS
jgi:hypothetical protein